ncbi:MAG: lipid-A-disaccharide synthase [Candidatus Contendobacter sp.]|jgi:lipid-A-disaccharide synthase|nr:lipid-A-disaccharide synthase [Gammaproteobacteria bacterium]MCC8994069.1 lipid-A-disaccharide synthase [Candidatus Contendobacter sp.]
MHIALVAGELSGDLLGAPLIAALQSRYPHARFSGVGGPAMIAQGLQSQVPLERLAVMGLVEVLRHLPELLRIRRQLYRHLLADPPAVLIGIDAPDFNLGLERRLRVHGIPTVHYVSPSVWAWRPWRVRKIARSVDLILTLLPFEAGFYQDRGVPVRYVGHPLADAIPLHSDPVLARLALNLPWPAHARIVALLPGSRVGEVKRLGPLFLETAQWLHSQRPDLHFLLPAATPALHDLLEMMRLVQAPDVPLTLLQGHSREAMTAAEVVLLASGTATLEAMLLKRPMVAAYRVAPLTAWIARPFVSTPYFALPNLLAGRELIPEFIQDAATVANLGPAVLRWLEDDAAREALTAEFAALHGALRCDANQKAAEAVAELLEQSLRPEPPAG